MFYTSVFVFVAGSCLLQRVLRFCSVCRVLSEVLSVFTDCLLLASPCRIYRCSVMLPRCGSSGHHRPPRPHVTDFGCWASGARAACSVRVMTTASCTGAAAVRSKVVVTPVAGVPGVLRLTLLLLWLGFASAALLSLFHHAVFIVVT